MAVFYLYNNNDHIAQEPAISLVSGSDFVPNITSINAIMHPPGCPFIQDDEEEEEMPTSISTPLLSYSTFSPFYANTPFSHETTLASTNNPIIDQYPSQYLILPSLYSPPPPPEYPPPSSSSSISSTSIENNSNNNSMMSGGTADHIKVEVDDHDEFICKKHKKSCNDDQGDQLIKHSKKKIKRKKKKKEVVVIKVDEKEKQENDVLNVVATQAQAATNYTDYVHVRARRGQATDSHSLAERARREKISQRMQHLQSLVPGCDKINGKALILDEIINYILSLQNQVEFLAAKLASVHLGMELQSDSNCRLEKRFCPCLDPTTTTTLPMVPSMLHESNSFRFGSAAGSTTEILMTIPSSDSFILQKPLMAEKSTIFPISMVMEGEDLQWDVEEEEDQCMKTKVESGNCGLDQLCSKYLL